MSEQDPDDIDIKDLVFNKLENTPFLRNIKAQLRTQIYHLIETGAPASNPADSPKSLNTDNERLALSLVEDLLKHFGLQYTRLVMKSECNLKATKTVQEIQSALELPDEPTSVPLLIQLLNKLRPDGSLSETITLDTNRSPDNTINDTVSYNSI